MSATLPVIEVLSPRSQRRETKRPEFDLPPLRADALVLATPSEFERPAPHHDNHRVKRPVVVDLFSGAGGLSLGFELAGFHIALGVDSDRWACQTFSANLRAPAMQLDIENIANASTFLRENGVEHLDGVIGGPPCQGFSRVGKGRMRHRDLLSGAPLSIDHRNQLYRSFLAFVRATEPKFFVVENVPDLARYDDGHGCLADRVEQEFRELGYRTARRVLCAADYGVPQTRSRLFFVGLHESLGVDIRWPGVQPSLQRLTLRDAIGDLPSVPDGHLAREIVYEQTPSNWFQRWARRGMPLGKEAVLFDHITRPHRDDDKDTFRIMPEGGRYFDLPSKHQRYRNDIFRDKYRKLSWDMTPWTITAHLRRDTYRYIHPDSTNPRTISVREAARIQSFPDWWRFAGYRSNAFTQIGNAVPPLLARALAVAIHQQMHSPGVFEDR